MVSLIGYAKGIAEDVKVVAQNPFGLEFSHDRDGRVVCTLGSLLNCLGYIDTLERIVGVARVAIGLTILAVSQDRRNRLVAACHVGRGVMEMIGSFEGFMLAFDVVGTVFIYARKKWEERQSEETEGPPIAAVNSDVGASGGGGGGGAGGPASATSPSFVVVGSSPTTSL